MVVVFESAEVWRYEQGLSLLLNAADLELEPAPQALIRTLPSPCPESLLKQMRQLALYEVLTAILPLPTPEPTLSATVAQAVGSKARSLNSSASNSTAVVNGSANNSTAVVNGSASNSTAVVNSFAHNSLPTVNNSDVNAEISAVNAGNSAANTENSVANTRSSAVNAENSAGLNHALNELAAEIANTKIVEAVPHVADIAALGREHRVNEERQGVGETYESLKRARMQQVVAASAAASQAGNSANSSMEINTGTVTSIRALVAAEAAASASASVEAAAHAHENAWREHELAVRGSTSLNDSMVDSNVTNYQNTNQDNYQARAEEAQTREQMFALGIVVTPEYAAEMLDKADYVLSC